MEDVHEPIFKAWKFQNVLTQLRIKFDRKKIMKNRYEQ